MSTTKKSVWGLLVGAANEEDIDVGADLRRDRQSFFNLSSEAKDYLPFPVLARRCAVFRKGCEVVVGSKVWRVPSAFSPFGLRALPPLRLPSLDRAAGVVSRVTGSPDAPQVTQEVFTRRCPRWGHQKTGQPGRRVRGVMLRHPSQIISSQNNHNLSPVV